MASINIQYNCGCGFKTKKLEAATDHADEKGHVLTVQGNIYTDVVPLPIKHRKTTTPKPSGVVAVALEEAQETAAFLSMKDRLRRPAASS